MMFWFSAVAVVSVAALIADIAWSEMLRRRLEAEQLKNAMLADLLDQTMCRAMAAQCTAMAAQARDRSYANFLQNLRNDAVAQANEIIRRERCENDRLHTIINQKWIESSGSNR